MAGIKTKLYNLLRKSEKYTKTDMVYLVKGGFWLTLGQVVSSLAAFLLAIAFANLLPKETYGTYKYILSLFGLLAIPTLSGMGTAVTRAVAQGYDGSFLPALKLKIKWGLLGGLASVGLAGYYYFNNNTELTLAFLITAIFIPFMDSFGLYGSLLQGKKKFDVASKYGMWIKIIASISIFITIYFTKNLFAILFIYLASYSLLRLLFLKLSLKFIDNKKEDPGTISYGKHLSFVKMFNLISGNISNIIIFHFLGGIELALYSFLIAPTEQIRGLLKHFNTLYFPKLSNKNLLDNLNFKNFIKKITPLLIGVTGIMILYILIAPYLYKFIFPKYIEAVFMSQIYVITLLFTSITIILRTIITAQKKIIIIYKINILDSLFIFLITIPLIYFYGLWGMIVSIFIIKMVDIILLFYFIFYHKKSFKLK